MKAKKGFTLVELLVVIAILAILATVSVVSYMSFIEAANRSADEQAVVQMNKVLEGNEVLGDVPTNIVELKDILADAGINSKSVVPVSSGYRFFWDSVENLIILVNTQTNVAEYPDDATYTKGDERYRPLDDVPEASTNEIEGESLKAELHDFNTSSLGFSVTMEAGVKYSCMDYKEMIENSPYKDYYADFRVTFSKALTYDNKSGTENGKVGAMLIGQYFSSNVGGGYGDYPWIPLACTGDDGTKNEDGTQTVYVMAEKMNMYFTYEEVVTQVGVFECGIKMVYDDGYSSTFTDYDNQDMDGADKEFLDGLTVSIDLVLCKEHVPNNVVPKGYNTDEEIIVVNTYTITYHVDDAGNLTITRE